MEENIIVKVGADISNLARGMSEGAKSVQNFEQSVKKINRLASGISSVGATIGATFGAVSAATTTALAGMVKTTVDFDTALRRAGAIAGATSGELEEMRSVALDLGASTTKSASEVATAMTEMAAKGYDANQIIAAMPGIIAAAEASGEDLALTADTVSSALNAFGLEASEATRVADVLAETANKSAAGIQDMQYKRCWVAGKLAA